MADRILRVQCVACKRSTYREGNVDKIHIKALAVQNNNVIKLDITGANLANFFINLPKGLVIMGAERETNTDIYRVRFGTTIRNGREIDGWRDVLPIDRANRLLEMPFTPFQESVAATDTRVSVRGTVTAIAIPTPTKSNGEVREITLRLTEEESVLINFWRACSQLALTQGQNLEIWDANVKYNRYMNKVVLHVNDPEEVKVVVNEINEEVEALFIAIVEFGVDTVTMLTDTGDQMVIRKEPLLHLCTLEATAGIEELELRLNIMLTGTLTEGVINPTEAVVGVE